MPWKGQSMRGIVGQFASNRGHGASRLCPPYEISLRNHERAHVLDYDTFTPSIATTRKLGFSVSSSCVFNS